MTLKNLGHWATPDTPNSLSPKCPKHCGPHWFFNLGLSWTLLDSGTLTCESCDSCESCDHRVVAKWRRWSWSRVLVKVEALHAADG